jgi:hypothetical protein
MRTILAICVLLACHSVTKAQWPNNGIRISRYTPNYTMPYWYLNSLPYGPRNSLGYYPNIYPRISQPVYNRVPVFRPNVRTGRIYNKHVPARQWRPN